MDEIIHWILRLGWLLGVWLFAFGAAVGSFLNVVVYRLPAGKSLVRPGSSCPACGHPIRWYHNIPILSWLVLRGRCYDCGTKISARYPLVELAGGLLFVGLAAVEVWPAAAKAAGLPAFMPHASGADIVARYCYHLWLLATLLGAALIERDGHAVPRRMVFLGAVVGLAVAIGWPAVQPEFGHVLPLTWNVAARWSGFAASGAGGLTGLLAGWIFGLVATPSSKNLPALQQRLTEVGRPDAATLACVGTFFGWQGAVLVGLTATFVWLMIDSRRNRPHRGKKQGLRWGWTALVLLAAIGWILLTRAWYDRPARWMQGEMPMNSMQFNRR
ncbi:MAG TPA: prepilin peptidase [Pirellulales bacterium]|jgi:prepilin signal peptidase PulO-like enzyme (type II secretory pathway)|nr:prepilin peptidase [Pirellulales bacterium]